MRRLMGAAPIAVLLAFALISPSESRAQELTERYIPIGRSPGVSGVTSVIGEIESVDPQSLDVTVRSQAGVAVQFRVMEDTRIWIDRSSQRLTNVPGTFEDCQVGNTIEVEFIDSERREVADWVKVAGGS